MSNDTKLREALALCIRKRITFAAFRLPGHPVRIWAQRNPETENAGRAELPAMERVFITAPFVLEADRLPFIRAEVDLSFEGSDTDINVLGQCSGTTVLPRKPDARTSILDFIRNVERAKEACVMGDLRKVVLSRVKNADIPAEQWPGLFRWAMEDNPRTLVALCHTPEHGLWMGASPERLVKASGDHVRVDSIAATRPAEAVPATIPEWGPKELDEQAQVTAFIRECMAGSGLSGLKVEGPQVLHAGPVAHLHTVLEAELGNVPLMDLVLRLHPTPAVCGAPTEAARRFIQTHEKHDRSLYTGFWGPWNLDGATELFVNLRCMHLMGGQTQLFVGAGITAGSDAEMEWNETERKARTWLRALETSAQAN